MMRNHFNCHKNLKRVCFFYCNYSRTRESEISDNLRFLENKIQMKHNNMHNLTTANQMKLLQTEYYIRKQLYTVINNRCIYDINQIVCTINNIT